MEKSKVSITSTSNPKVKAVCGLRDRKDRDATGLFLIEGFREISRAVQAKVGLQELFYCPKLFLGENEDSLLHSATLLGCRCIEVSENVLQKISYRDRPDGLVSVAKKMNTRLVDVSETLKKNPLVVIAEGIEKPGNLGTIIRSSDAAGADLVIVTNGCTDIYNPNVVRASVGTLFTIPVVEASNDETLSFCQDKHLFLVAATPEAAVRYTDVPLKQGVGIVVGTEQLGLTEFWKNACQCRAAIPMHGVADSLNVAMATTIILFEAVRQRNEH
jgi:TrmH family RNA methyltransferase